VGLRLLGQQGLRLGLLDQQRLLLLRRCRGDGERRRGPRAGPHLNGLVAAPAPPVLGTEAGLPPPDGPLPEDDDCSPERGLPPRRRRFLERPPEFPPPELEPPLREAWGVSA